MLSDIDLRVNMLNPKIDPKFHDCLKMASCVLQTPMFEGVLLVSGAGTLLWPSSAAANVNPKIAKTS